MTQPELETPRKFIVSRGVDILLGFVAAGLIWGLGAVITVELDWLGYVPQVLVLILILAAFAPLLTVGRKPWLKTFGISIIVSGLLLPVLGLIVLIGACSQMHI